MSPRLDTHAEGVSALFTRIARRYDLMNRLMTFGQDLRWRRLAAQRASPEPGELALDLGAGTGDMSLALMREEPSTFLASADFNTVMLAGAQAKGIANLVAADAQHLPFADAVFNVLASGFLVRNVSDLDQALGEMRRVLKKGGRVVILDTTRASRNLLSPLIRFYLNIVIPLMGWLLTGDREAYCYLPTSTAGFLSADELSAKMKDAGFGGVGHLHLMSGVVALHWALIQG